MASGSGRLNAGTLAALGTSLALHVGLAILLLARRPPAPDAAPSTAVSVSIAAPTIATLGAVPTASVAAARPGVAEGGVAAAVPVAELAASSLGPVPTLPPAAPSTGITEAPASLAAVPALGVPVSKAHTPAAPLGRFVPAVPVAGTAVDATPRQPEARVAVAPEPDPKPSPAPAAVKPGKGVAAKPLEAQAIIAEPAATAAAIATKPLEAELPATSAHLPEAATGSRPPPPTAAVAALAGTPDHVAGVARAAIVPPVDGTMSAVRPARPSPLALSPSSEPQHLAQAGRPDSTLMAHEETEAERVRLIRSFVDRYDGGPCFLMAPARHVTAELEIDGFATDRDKIHRFDDDFKETTGREARVVAQWISQRQCPVVDFLRATKPGTRGLRVEIERRDLRKGDLLSGTIEGVGSEPLHLYWIDETGAVSDVSDHVRERGEDRTFDVPVRRDIVGGPYPQLLVAVVGDRLPIPTILEAGPFFTSLAAGALAGDRPLAASGRPFRLVP